MRSLFLAFHADDPNFIIHFFEKNKNNMNPTNFLFSVGKFIPL